MREEFLERFLDLISEIESYDRTLLQECSYILVKRMSGQVDEGGNEEKDWEGFLGKEYYWIQIEEQMEKILENRMTMTPKIAATIVRRYHRIRPQMMPKLIKIAQRVKNRLRMRRIKDDPNGYHEEDNPELKNLYRDR